MQIKEFLDTEKGYVLVKSTCKRSEDWIEVPGWAQLLSTDGNGNGLIFWKDGLNLIIDLNDELANGYESFSMFCSEYPRCKILWQRPQQPESLPFVDDEVQILNDQYAEIEQIRQDMINHPSHYTQGKVECIDALESATIGKSGIEAVCVANVIKYLWRYEEKNGIEDVKKAQFYLNRLLATLENNNG